MSKPTDTVRELIRNSHESLTQSERKLANSLLENYPVSGLSSITAVAVDAGVSSPTVARMVQKLGFSGYSQFQRALREEVAAQISGPTQRRDAWAAEAPDSHLLNRFADSVMRNLSQTFAHLDAGVFDQAVNHLAQSERHLFVVGGRITRSLAEYAFTHLQAIRPRITHMTSSSATWPHYVLDMNEGDVLLLFDVRRYETNLQRLAEMAAERGLTIILITDQWSSPIAKLATCSFNCWAEIPSAWDSNVSTLMLLEALIAATQEENWPEAGDRYERLDALFDTTRLFRKFT